MTHSESSTGSERQDAIDLYAGLVAINSFAAAGIISPEETDDALAEISESTQALTSNEIATLYDVVPQIETFAHELKTTLPEETAALRLGNGVADYSAAKALQLAAEATDLELGALHNDRLLTVYPGGNVEDAIRDLRAQ